jgi:hypothetical protein
MKDEVVTLFKEAGMPIPDAYFDVTEDGTEIVIIQKEEEVNGKT